MLKPLDNRVIVKPFPPEDKFMGRFSIPDEYKVDPNAGEVISVGSEVKDIKPGNIAIYDGNYGVNIIDEGETYRVLEKKNIFAIK